MKPTSPSDSPSHERLRALLRHGDPAGDGREPSAEETRQLRARVLEAAHAATPEARRLPRPALAFGGAAVAAFALLVVLAVLPLRRGHLAPEGTPAAEAVTSATEAPRQVHFTTPGGTRIVWVLYPESP